MSQLGASAPATRRANKYPTLQYDPALVEGLKALNIQETFQTVESMRKTAGSFHIEDFLKGYPKLEHIEHRIPGPEDNPNGEITLSVFQPKDRGNAVRPACYHIHGGGQIAGNRFAGAEMIMRWFEDISMVHVFVEYRLAPEHPAPAALNDCYTGLVWMADHAERLGIDTMKLMIEGTSGGGPLAAACAILARNHQYPALCAQLLSTPMLDDRNITVSAQQFDDNGPWNRTINRAAWRYVLGSSKDAADVSELISPSRATDLAGVASAFIDVGEAEVFRDEGVAYAHILWRSGVSAELHVWPGAYHGFDFLVPKAPVSQAAENAKRDWVRRVFGFSGALGKEVNVSLEDNLV